MGACVNVQRIDTSGVNEHQLPAIIYYVYSADFR